MSRRASKAPRRSHAWLEIITLVGIALFGAVLRIRQWLEARSLWVDETFLAASFNDLGFPGILTQQLVNGQSAPPGFLLATQASTRLFGFDEQALRLAALLAGLAMLAIAIIVADRLLTHPMARIAFVTLVALSPSLIYYSNELKQYSSDALALMVILLLWSVRDQPRHVALLASGGFLVAVFSLVGIIALLAFGIALAVEHFSDSSEDRATNTPGSLQPAELNRRSAIVGSAWSAGIALHGWYTLRSGTDREYMQIWWGINQSFPPDSIESAAELEWYPLSIMRLIWVGIGEDGRLQAARPSTGSVLVAIIVIALLIVTLRTRRDLRYFVLAIFAFAWVLSEMRIYPTSGRLSLYLVPIVFIGVAAGLDSVLRTRNLARSMLATGGVGIVVFIQLVISSGYLTEPLNDRNMKWISSELETRATQNDTVIISPEWTGAIAEWYRVPALVQAGNYLAADGIDDLPDDIARGERDRVWVISSHLSQFARGRVDELTQIGYEAICVEEFRDTYLALLLRPDLAADADPEELCRLVNPY